jgi:uncharacterized protein (TIGR02391 family)
MNDSRSRALAVLITELEEFKIDVTTYFSDAEPQAFFDTVLTGKLTALAHFCKILGWSELSQHLNSSVPVRCTAVETMELVHGFVLPEIKRLVAKTEIDSVPSPIDWFWQFVHPRIKALARPRFEAGFFGDAVETVFKETNDAVKLIVRDQTGKELDGHGLMTTAFSPSNPIIRLNSLVTDSDRSMQQGYMEIFAGAMTGIRNPKAHGNLNPEPRRALHLIALASLLLYQIDERV